MKFDTAQKLTEEFFRRIKERDDKDQLEEWFEAQQKLLPLVDQLSIDYFLMGYYIGKGSTYDEKIRELKDNRRFYGRDLPH